MAVGGYQETGPRKWHPLVCPECQSLEVLLFLDHTSQNLSARPTIGGVLLPPSPKLPNNDFSPQVVNVDGVRHVLLPLVIQCGLLTHPLTCIVYGPEQCCN